MVSFLKEKPRELRRCADEFKVHERTLYRDIEILKYCDFDISKIGASKYYIPKTDFATDIFLTKKERQYLVNLIQSGNGPEELVQKIKI